MIPRPSLARFQTRKPYDPPNMPGHDVSSVVPHSNSQAWMSWRAARNAVPVTEPGGSLEFGQARPIRRPLLPRRQQRKLGPPTGSVV